MKTGKYQHYKGADYQVLGVVCHTETRQKMVLYKALYKCPELRDEYGDDPLFVRPYEMFNELVEIEGKSIPRFRFID